MGEPARHAVRHLIPACSDFGLSLRRLARRRASLYQVVTMLPAAKDYLGVQLHAFLMAFNPILEGGCAVTTQGRLQSE